jgi:hypothetical protein
MARLTFLPSDDAYVRAYTGEPQAGIPVTVWTRQVGGTQVTDLVSVGYDGTLGAAITGGILVSDASGLLPAFAGPDGGPPVLWGSHGVSGERLALYSVSGGGGGGWRRCLLRRRPDGLGYRDADPRRLHRLHSPRVEGGPGVSRADGHPDGSHRFPGDHDHAGRIHGVHGCGRGRGNDARNDSRRARGSEVREPVRPAVAEYRPNQSRPRRGGHDEHSGDRRRCCTYRHVRAGQRYLVEAGCCRVRVRLHRHPPPTTPRPGCRPRPTLKWDDGTTGTFTGTIDGGGNGYSGFAVTWAGSTTRTVTATGITYDANGNAVGPTGLAVS